MNKVEMRLEKERKDWRVWRSSKLKGGETGLLTPS